jgi:hypothetical protein
MAKNWIKKATSNMRTDKPCTGSKFGSSTCPPGSKRYNLAKTFRSFHKQNAGPNDMMFDEEGLPLLPGDPMQRILPGVSTMPNTGQTDIYDDYIIPGSGELPEGFQIANAGMDAIRGIGAVAQNFNSLREEAKQRRKLLDIKTQQIQDKDRFGLNPASFLFQQGGNISQPTSADSLAIYNNSNALLNYYRSKGYTPLGQNNQKLAPGDKSVFNRLDSYAGGFSPDTPRRVPGNQGYVEKAVSKEDYRKNLDRNKFLQREEDSTILDTRAPMALYDKRILPDTRYQMTNNNTGDPMFGDVVDMFGYDPSTIKPRGRVIPNQPGRQRFPPAEIASTNPIRDSFTPGILDAGPTDFSALPAGQPVYGPENSMIGTFSGRQFNPLKGDRSRYRLNPGDVNLLNNSTDLNSFITRKGLQMKQMGGKTNPPHLPWASDYMIPSGNIPITPRPEVNPNYQSGSSETFSNLGRNMASYFLGVKNSSLIPSPYKPTKSTDPNAKYNTWQYLKNDVKSDLIDPKHLENINTQQRNFAEQNPKYLPSYVDQPTFDQLYNYHENSPHSNTISGSSINLGHYSVTPGNDDRGRYFGIHDKYDWDLLEGLGMKGKPFETYDRIYEDEWDKIKAKKRGSTNMSENKNNGGIYIKPSHRGKFTRWAKSHDMTVEEATSKVLANKDNYSGSVIKMAQFSRNIGGNANGGFPNMEMQNAGLAPIGGIPQGMPAEVFAETGEVARMQNGDIVQIDPSMANTYDHGEVNGIPGTGINGAQSFLEATSTKKGRTTLTDKLLKVNPDIAESIVGFRPKTAISHAKLMEQASEFYGKRRNKLQKIIDSQTKNGVPIGNLAAQNSIRLNGEQLSTIPTDSDIYDTIFQHQEGVKSLYGISDGPTEDQVAQYQSGGFVAQNGKPGRFQRPVDVTEYYRRNFGYDGPQGDIGAWQTWMANNEQLKPGLVNYLKTVPITNKGRQLYGNVEPGALNQNQLLNQFQDKKYDFRAYPAPVNANIFPSSGLPPGGQIPMDLGPNIGLPGESEFDFGTPISRDYITDKTYTGKKDKFPLEWYDTLPANEAWLSAMNRDPETAFQVNMPRVQYKRKDPTQALREIDSDASAAMANLPSGTAGAAIRAQIQGNRDRSKSGILSQYDNENVGILNRQEDVNADYQSKEDLTNTQLKQNFVDNYLKSRAVAEQQRLQSIDSLSKTVARNKQFNRMVNLMDQKDYDVTSDGSIVYNGNWQINSPTGNPVPLTGGVPNKPSQYQFKQDANGRLVRVNKLNPNDIQIVPGIKTRRK